VYPWCKRWQRNDACFYVSAFVANDVRRKCIFITWTPDWRDYLIDQMKRMNESASAEKKRGSNTVVVSLPDPFECFYRKSLCSFCENQSWIKVRPLFRKQKTLSRGPAAISACKKYTNTAIRIPLQRSLSPIWSCRWHMVDFHNHFPIRIA